MFNEAQHQTLPEKKSAYFDELYRLYRSLYNKTLAHADQDTRKRQLNYDEYRQSGLYKTIKKSLAANTPVTQAEYYFYALVTDDVSKLDANNLDSYNLIQLALSTPNFRELNKAIDWFRQNLSILAAALRHQNDPTAETFTELKGRLELQAKQNFAHKEGGPAVIFINLSGITLPAVTGEMGELAFHCCYFQKATLDSMLSFEALHSIFLETNLDASLEADRSYGGCELISVKATILAQPGCLFANSNIKTSKLSITIMQDLHFEGCEIFRSEIAIKGERDGEIGSLHSCRVLCSTISLDYGILRWQKNTIIKAVISNDLTWSAKHDFKDQNIIESTDLRKVQIVDLVKFLISDQFPTISLSIYDDGLFASPEVFRQLLTSIHKEISAFINKLLDKSLWVYSDVEKVQEAFAKVLVSHIQAYYPFESHALDAISLLEEALRHPVFKNQSQIGLKSIFGSLFAACSTSTKAREVLSEALNEVTMNCSQHTALSRLASF